MKFTNTNITNTKEILYNDHYVAIPYDCSKLTAGSDGIIKAGTIIMMIRQSGCYCMMLKRQTILMGRL